MVPGMAVMFSAMMMARPRFCTVVAARPVPDNDQVSELIQVSVVSVMIAVGRAGISMMIVPGAVVIVAATTPRLGIRTGQHEAPKDKDDSEPLSRFILRFHTQRIAAARACATEER